MGNKKRVFDFNRILKSRDLYEETKKQLSDDILNDYKSRKSPAVVLIRR